MTIEMGCLTTAITVCRLMWQDPSTRALYLQREPYSSETPFVHGNPLLIPFDVFW